MKVIARKINLNPREKTNKKVDKEYSKSEATKSTKKPKSEFKFQIKDVAIYVGNVIPENHNKECKIIKPKSKYGQEYYQIEFNGEEKIECHVDFLKTQEEYELDKLNQIEHKSTNIDKKLIEKGIELYDNDQACLNPPKYYERSCEQCCFEKRCSYRSKGVYRKLSC